MTTPAYPAAYYPLVINYISPDNTREWSLKFQLRPTHEITFSGDVPTRDEIIQCLTLMNMPMFMLELIEVVIGNELIKAVKGDIKPTLICPRCKVDRFKEPCPGPLHMCPIKGESQ